MADTLEATFAPRVTTTFTNTLTADGQSVASTVVANLNLLPVFSYTDGTTENKADKVIKITGQSIAASGTQDIDLYDLASLDVGAGAGRDNLGQTVALAEVCLLMILVRSTSTGSLTIGGKGAATGWSSPFSGSQTATVGPFTAGTAWIIATTDDPAFAVADGTNHVLKLAASGGTVVWDAIIIGRSA